MRRVVALATIGLLALAGCGETLGNGDTKVKPAVYGTWKASGADADCRWNVRTKKGVVIRSGRGSSPSLVLGPKDYDRVFSANAACGTWVKSK